MGFLTKEHDLSGTTFDPRHVSFARGYWTWMIERVDSSWLEDPRGDLGVHWRSDTLPSAARLIDLARRIWTLASRIDKQDQTVLGNKLETLLNSAGRQHDEILLEVIVGSMLPTLGGSIDLEPPSTQVAGDDSRRSVDFAVGENGDRVFIEITTLYLQRLLDWEAAVQNLKRRFEREMTRRECARQFQIIAPLSFTSRTVDDAKLLRLAGEIADSERGRREVSTGTELMVLEWGPVLHLQGPPGNLDTAGGHGFASVFGAAQFNVVAATSMRLKWPGEAEELVNRSLRNTLDGKRAQFRLAAPYILAFERGNHRIPRDGVIDLFQRRIFPNNLYDWLSGVVLVERGFTQRKGFDPTLMLIQNPGATHPIPSAFLSELLGEL